jgi:transmembrane sensor
MEDQDPRSIDPLTEEALSWLVRLHSGEETVDDWNAYHDWKLLDAAHAGAARRAEEMWSRLGPALINKRTTRNSSGAAALALFLLGAVAFSGALGTPASWLADEATGIGERRTVVLADGSSVTLDSATALDVAFSADERRIVLRDGQIYLTVTPDSRRAFVVEAEGGTVRALGTAFNVRLEDDGARVAVTEHAVRVRYGAAQSVDVRQGQGVGYAPSRGLGVPGKVNTAAITAWTHGEIVFDNQPLGAVVREISRYQRGTVIFTDDALKDLTITGVFATDDTDAFYAALERTLPVSVRRLPYVTLIGPRAKS